MINLSFLKIPNLKISRLKCFPIWRFHDAKNSQLRRYRTLSQLEKKYAVGIHMCSIKPHILMGEMSRSRSSFKVKGQIEGQKRATLTLVITFHLLQIATWYLASVFISLRRSLWWVTCQGHPSRSKVKLKVTTWYLAYIWVILPHTYWGVKC